jgi:hypothetical protein
MVAQSDKAILWQTIRAKHPALAKALQDARNRTDGQVMVDGYPAKTQRWIMGALEASNPALATLLKETVFPDKEFWDTVCNPTVTIATEDLIDALLAAEGLAKAA